MLKIHHRSLLPAGQGVLYLILNFVASYNPVACQSSNAATITGKNITTNSSQIDPTTNRPVILNPVGKTFIEHGELLNLTIKFNGTVPFRYCYKFCRATDILPCDFCLYPYIETYAYEVPISHYLHYVGNYTLMFEVRNSAGTDTKHWTIKVNETFREQTLPFAPIVSSILAVLILITGVTVHLHLRKTAHTETANFDFIRKCQEEEEWEEEQSFIQRVRYIFCRGNDDNSNDETLFNERQPLINRDNRKNSSLS